MFTSFKKTGEIPWQNVELGKLFDIALIRSVLKCIITNWCSVGQRGAFTGKATLVSSRLVITEDEIALNFNPIKMKNNLKHI
jgi:hypothetical protein